MRTRPILIASALGVACLAFDAGLAAWAKGGKARPARPKPRPRLTVTDVVVLRGTTQPPKGLKLRRSAATSLGQPTLRRIPWSTRLDQFRRQGVQTSSRAGSVYAVLTPRTPYVADRAALLATHVFSYSTVGDAFREGPFIDQHIGAAAEERDSLYPREDASLYVFVWNTVPGRSYLVEVEGTSQFGMGLDVFVGLEQRATFVGSRNQYRASVVITCENPGRYWLRLTPRVDTESRVTWWSFEECKITVL